MGVFEESTIVFESITPDIVHLRMPDRNNLATALCRLQEYYESPFPEIHGQVFTIGQLRAVGARNNPGVYTYEGGNFHRADWSGYNFPSSVLDPFIKGLFDPLTPHEQDIINALRCKPGKFYVIGTYGEDDPGQTLDHEICHALYYVNSNYKREVDEVIAEYVEHLDGIVAMLMDWGYGEHVIEDEIHAYVSADYDWLYEDKKSEVEKYNISIPRKMHTKLRSIKNKYFKGK